MDTDIAITAWDPSSPEARAMMGTLWERVGDETGRCFEKHLRARQR